MGFGGTAGSAQFIRAEANRLTAVSGSGPPDIFLAGSERKRPTRVTRLSCTALARIVSVEVVRVEHEAKLAGELADSADAGQDRGEKMCGDTGENGFARNQF